MVQAAARATEGPLKAEVVAVSGVVCSSFPTPVSPVFLFRVGNTTGGKNYLDDDGLTTNDKKAKGGE